MRVSNGQLRKLAPYLVGESPKANGEWDMHCPLHEDSQRSASLNIDKGAWHCNAGCGGGSISGLIDRRPEWCRETNSEGQAEAFKRVQQAARNRNGNKPAVSASVTEEEVQGWKQALHAFPAQLELLASTRGITQEVLSQFDIGLEREGVYTLPVRDGRGTVRNVRKYDVHAKKNGRRKIWSVAGLGNPWRLYPAPPDKDWPSVVICEGEWDALVAIQHGFNAVTRTCGATEPWLPEYTKYFEGKRVFVCFDMDEPGQVGSQIVYDALKNVADVSIVRLPFAVTKDHGKDVSDYLLNTPYASERFRNLLIGSVPPQEPDAEPSDGKESLPPSKGLGEVYEAERVGLPTRAVVTVRSKREPGYAIPSKVHFQCFADDCETCDGTNKTVDVPVESAINLELLDVPRNTMTQTLRLFFGIPKCKALSMEVLETRDVEVLWARASIDHDDEGSLAAHRILSIGRSTTRANTTIGIYGSLYPNPKSQLKEFLAWEVDPVESALDNYKLDKQTIKNLKAFRSIGESPLDTMIRIAEHHAQHVTKIFGRPEIHVLMDLVYHSALSFNFDGHLIDKGWLEALVVGDSRTGKSETALRLSEFYRCGELVSCEGSSFAGLVGGLQQFGGKEWQINWGTIPLNDRRLVILDEAGNLSHEHIAAMSSVRSAGVAELQKIQQDRTHARTRLIWIANPRNSRMQDYSYGVDTIRPLIGNNEDIARFDLAFSVREDDVDSAEMNRHHEGSPLTWSSDACHDLVRWVWSRTADQVLFLPEATAAIYEAAEDVGSRYTSDPPLVQAANVRLKIARVAVAIAARTFSSDETSEVIVVNEVHVKDAVRALDWLYNATGFGYAVRSTKQINRMETARKNIKAAQEYMRTHAGLEDFLRDTPRFKRQDLEEVITGDRMVANLIIQKMSQLCMFRKTDGFVFVEPPLIEFLRGE